MKPQAGFEKMIQQYYLEMYPKMLKYAQCILSEPSLAEEAVQESFRIACEKPESVCGSPNPSGWLMLTLKNVIRISQRNRSRLNRLVVASLDQEDFIVQASATDEHLDLEYSELLSAEDYRLLKLVALERCSMLEAAQEFGISVEACKKRVQRARKKLQKKLEEIEADMSPSDGVKTYIKGVSPDA